MYWKSGGRMKYITTQRHREMTLSGPLNIPALTPVELHPDGKLYLGDKPLHFVTSHRSHTYFSRDDDGRGMERFELCQEIIELCAEHCDPNDPWSDRLWQTPALQPYRQSQNNQRWLWNQRFYDADISELQWILSYLKEA